MEESTALKEVENSLRDFISLIMTGEKGEDWIESCGISPERIKIWKERREVENKKQKFGTPEKRLIYYSDFYDLAVIIEKNWFKTLEDAFGDKKTILLFLKILEDFRNPDAHRRELLPHQKHLIIGLSGEVRNRIILYRSKQETGEDYFPRLESVRDNLGNCWVAGDTPIYTKLILRPGDTIIFVVTATDPLGESLEYKCSGQEEWQSENTIYLKLEKKHISRNQGILIYMRSKRDYHANDHYDDAALFNYIVLPKK